MKLSPLPLESAVAEQANFELLVTHEDLTETTANTAQTLTFPIAAKMTVQCVRMILDEPFEDASDNAFNTTTVIVGDGGSTNRFLTSTELNVNGTEILLKLGTGTTLAYDTTDTIDLIFGSMAAKSLSDIDTGRARFLFRIHDERAVPAPV